MKNKVLVGICVGLFLVGLIGSVWVLSLPQGTQVNIIQDGSVLYSFDITDTDNQTIDIAYGDRFNTIQIENGKIRVLDADCPDKTCVHMGWLETGTLPIVCLPNHLVIEFSNTEEGIDAVIR